MVRNIHASNLGRRIITSAFVSLAVSFPAYGQSSTPAAPPAAHSNGSANGLNLNLSAATRTVNLGSVMPNVGAVVVNVGGANRTFTAASHVTPAEFVAIREVIATGHQALLLNATGAATGGAFNANIAASAGVNNLSIPKGVSAIDNIADASTLHIGGTFMNSGNVVVYSSQQNAGTGTISASDIFNTRDASIYSSVPLILSATNAINNAGTISGTSEVTLQAGSAVYNSGLIESQNGNLNIIGTGDNLAVNGTGGTFRAMNGDINITGQASHDSNLQMIGGDYLSRNLNITGGNIVGVVENVSGVLNTSGTASHFYANTPVLSLGTNCAEGDPTFVNSGGDIRLAGGVTANEAITIIASGNIIAQSGVDFFVSTANSVGATGVPNSDITLIAGANVVVSPGAGGNNTGIVDSTNWTPIDAGQTATVTGASATGGKIDLRFSLHNGALLDSSSTHSAGGNNQINGGNITLAAYAAGNQGGVILLPSNSFVDSSSANGNGGNILMIAGAAPGTPQTALTAGKLFTSGANNSGSVSLVAAVPTTTDGGGITFDSTGSVTSGNAITYPATSSTTNAGISVGDIITAGLAGKGATAPGGNGGNGGNAGSVYISTNYAITTGNIFAFGGGGGGGAGATNPTTIGGSGGNGGNGASSIQILGGSGAITINGGINGSGGGGGGRGGTAFGLGGTGGTATAQIDISGIGTFSATDAIYNINGTTGGGEHAPANAGGSGGGASFGGGGGGGGGFSNFSAPTTGGGGGGGLFGGGGGGAASFGGNGAGGDGGGALLGGIVSGGNGGAGSGGSGLSGALKQGGAGGQNTVSGGNGGALGQPGTGGLTPGIAPLVTGETGFPLNVYDPNATNRLSITFSVQELTLPEIVVPRLDVTTGPLGHVAQNSGSIVTAAVAQFITPGGIGSESNPLQTSIETFSNIQTQGGDGPIYISNAAGRNVNIGQASVKELYFTEADGYGVLAGSNGAVQGFDALSVIVNGVGDISGFVRSDNLTLSTKGGNVNVNYIPFVLGNATLNAFDGVSNAGDVTLRLSLGNVNFVSNGAISNYAKNFNVISNAGDITVNGGADQITAIDSIALQGNTAQGKILQGVPGTALHLTGANSLATVSLRTNAGDIGSATQSVQTDAALLHFDTGVAANVFVTDTASSVKLIGDINGTNISLNVPNGNLIFIQPSGSWTASVSSTINVGGNIQANGIWHTPSFTVSADTISLTTDATVLNLNAATFASVRDTAVSATISGANSAPQLNVSMVNDYAPGAYGALVIGPGATISGISTVLEASKISAADGTSEIQSFTPTFKTYGGDVGSAALPIRVSGSPSIDTTAGGIATPAAAYVDLTNGSAGQIKSFVGNDLFIRASNNFFFSNPTPITARQIVVDAKPGSSSFGVFYSGAPVNTTQLFSLNNRYGTLSKPLLAFAAQTSTNFGFVNLSSTGNINFAGIEQYPSFLSNSTVLNMVSGGNILLGLGLSTNLGGSLSAHSGATYSFINGVAVPMGRTAQDGNVVLATNLTAGGSVNVHANGSATVGTVTAGGGVDVLATSDINTQNITAGNNIAVTSITGSVVTGNLANSNLASGLNSIAVESPTSVYAGTLSAVNYKLTATNGTVSILGPNLVALPDSLGNGGTIAITSQAPLENHGPSTTAPFLLQASGAAGGAGGKITVKYTGTTPLAIGSGEGQYQLKAEADANSGTTGGQVSFSNGGNLTVDPAAIDVSSPNGGASLSLASGANLFVKGTLSAPGGSIALDSSSKTAFTIGTTAKTNGITGVGAVDTFSAINRNGGLTDKLSFATAKSVDLVATNGNLMLPGNIGSNSTDVVSLRVLGTGNVVNAAGTITSKDILVSAQTGTISALKVAGPAAGFDFRALAAPTRIVTVNNTSANPMTIAGNVGTLNVTSVGNVLQDGVSAAKAITITSKGEIVNASSNKISAPTLSLSAGSGVNLTTVTSTVSMKTTAGNVFIDNLTSLTPLTVKSAVGKANVTVNSGGDIKIAAPVGSATSDAVTVASLNGAITATGVLTARPDNFGTVLLLAPEGVGTAKAPIKTSAAALTALSNNGLVNVNNTGKALLQVFNLSAGKSLSLTSAGPIDLSFGATANNGALLVQAGGGELKVGSHVTATNGGITLLNKDAAKGTISIADNADIKTLGTGDNKVIVALGAAPKAPIAGPVPSNIDFQVDGSPVSNPPPAGLFFFGKNGINVQPTLMNPTLNSNGGGQVIFNTGTRTPDAITIKGGTISALKAVAYAPRAMRRGPVGNVLAPKKDETVDVRVGKLSVGAGAVVLIVHDDEVVSIYNLHDAHAGDVQLKVGNQTIMVAPGRQVTISDAASNAFDTANPIEAFAYRDVKPLQLQSVGSAFTSEFHTGIAIKSVKVLREAVQQRTALGNILLRTSASLQMLGRNKPSFAIYSKRTVAAYAPQ